MSNRQAAQESLRKFQNHSSIDSRTTHPATERCIPGDLNPNKCILYGDYLKSYRWTTHNSKICTEPVNEQKRIPCHQL